MAILLHICFCNVISVLMVKICRICRICRQICIFGPKLHNIQIAYRASVYVGRRFS
jgi:hypothetical protein